MGHLHPPSQNCHALDIMEFWDFIYKNLILIAFLVKNVQLHPPRQISGYATGQVVAFGGGR